MAPPPPLLFLTRRRRRRRKKERRKDWQLLFSRLAWTYLYFPPYFPPCFEGSFCCTLGYIFARANQIMLTQHYFPPPLLFFIYITFVLSSFFCSFFLQYFRSSGKGEVRSSDDSFFTLRGPRKDCRRKRGSECRKVGGKRERDKKRMCEKRKTRKLLFAASGTTRREDGMIKKDWMVIHFPLLSSFSACCPIQLPNPINTPLGIIISSDRAHFIPLPPIDRCLHMPKMRPIPPILTHHARKGPLDNFNIIQYPTLAQMGGNTRERNMSLLLLHLREKVQKILFDDHFLLISVILYSFFSYASLLQKGFFQEVQSFPPPLSLSVVFILTSSPLLLLLVAPGLKKGGREEMPLSFFPSSK